MGVALEGFPLIRSGDDLGKIIVETASKNGLEFEDGDVIVAAQKIFSKAEGRVFSLQGVVASRRAQRLANIVKKDPRFVELVLKETKKVLKASPEVLLVEDVRGLVCINAGIDKSNVKGKNEFALLPENPDKSAQECGKRIRHLTGKRVGIVMSDTYSRPFRRGQVNFAIGVADVNLFRDYRGKSDLFGQVLKVKNVAVIDEIAAAAELVMGQGKEGKPVIILRGLDAAVVAGNQRRVEDVFISRKEDLFQNTV